MEEEKKAPLHQGRVIELMPGLEPIEVESPQFTVKSFLEESLSPYDAPIKVQASFPPLDEKIDTEYRANGFVRAFMTAYANHLPLEISPDDIWLTVCQGFCTHILQNAEKLRKEFVDFDGKKELKIDLDSFIFGSPDNDWTMAFGSFSAQIKEIIGAKMHSIFVHKFSTTTSLHTTIYEATLLSAMQKYFDYTICSACGIPRVRMLGKPEDWKELREKVASLSKYGVEWWIVKLLPVIDKLVAAAVDGEQDQHFWNSVGKVCFVGDSGSYPALNGWIANFFPYLNQKKNEQLRDLNEVLETMKTFNPDDLEEIELDEEEEAAMTPEQKIQLQERIRKNEIAMEVYYRFPNMERFQVGITEAPFKWEYHDQVHEMKFLSGFIGIERTADGYLKPKIGWAIAHKAEPEQNEEENGEEEEEEEENEVE